MSDQGEGRPSGNEATSKVKVRIENTNASITVPKSTIQKTMVFLRPAHMSPEQSAIIDAMPVQKSSPDQGSKTPSNLFTGALAR